MNCFLDRPEIPQPSDPTKRNIALTLGMFTTINACDFSRVDCNNWCAKVASDGKHYAVRSGIVNGKKMIVYLHRFLLGVTNPEIEVDHKRPLETLNNCRENIRIATRAQNAANGLKKRGRSKYKGVTFRGRRAGESAYDSWRGQIIIGGKRMYLGTFRIEEGSTRAEEAAARAYDTAAIKYFGEFAYLNFPNEH